MNSFQKATKKLLYIALILQTIYLLSVTFISLFPKIILPIFGHSGNYDVPFVGTYFWGAVIRTVLFVLICIVMISKINGDKNMGIGSSIVLGIYTYFTYFSMENILGFIYSRKTSTLIEELLLNVENNSSLTATAGENAAGVSYLSGCYGAVKLWFFAAIILMASAHSIYRFYCKNKEE